MNEQGAAVVQFFIDENSKVHDWTIALSSGASRLDEAAIKFIARASFDPAHVKLNPIHTDVPYKVTVVFCLEKGDCDRIATYPYSLRVVVLGERPKRRDIVVPIP
jgi:TonB family protein